MAAAFDNVNKMLAKAATLVAKEGIPDFYFKMLILLETECDRATESKAALKSLNSSNAKAVNTLKQKLRKVTQPYKAKLDPLREKKAAPTGGDDGSEDDDDKPPAKVVETAAAKPKGKGGGPPTGPKEIKNYNEQDIDERLDELLSKRGRKGTNKQEEISILKQLSNVTKRPSKLVTIGPHHLVQL